MMRALYLSPSAPLSRIDDLLKLIAVELIPCFFLTSYSVRLDVVVVLRMHLASHCAIYLTFILHASIPSLNPATDTLKK